jgi:protein SDA1
MGINTIREIASKQHNILDSEKLSYICDFADYKNKNVNQSSKSIINLYRDVNPKLLHKKFRGRVENEN